VTTVPDPLYRTDPEAWNAHLAEGNARQARKRVSVDALIRDQQGRILLVNPTYKPDWDVPGGMVEENEPLTTALERELTEELSITPTVGPLLCVEWVPPHGPWDDLLAFIFDAGVIASADLARVRLADGELSGYEFCTSVQAEQRLRPNVYRRLTTALHALESGRPGYLQDGRLL
jgi:ADP-ribose pyrophosphatase YjhB (NUDIX family)